MGWRWAEDVTNAIMQKAREVAECIDIEADFVQDADPKERIEERKRSSVGPKSQRAIIGSWR